MPAANPPRNTLSRPDIDGLKPTPKASNVLTLPKTSMRPCEGGIIPAITRIIEDLPAPFVPITPKTWPYSTSRFTLSRARITRVCFDPRPKDLTRAFNVGLRSMAVVYVRPRPRTETAISLVLCALETDGKFTLP